MRVKVKASSNDNLSADDVIGIDCGGAVPFMISDGAALSHAIEPLPRSGRAKRGKRLQQQLARCHKGSKRRQAAKARLASFKAREKRCRKDMIEWATAELAKMCRVAVVEDLRVQAMTASARGTVENAGSNVAAKAGLNRVILDKGWGMFRVRLGQKLAVKGGKLLNVPANHTSQRCAACGHVAAALRLSQAFSRCASCGHEADADHNAACNIRHLGLVRLGLADPDGPRAAVRQPEAKPLLNLFRRGGSSKVRPSTSTTRSTAHAGRPRA